jgi:phospholipase/carboxylesterase
MGRLTTSVVAAALVMATSGTLMAAMGGEVGGANASAEAQQARLSARPGGPPAAAPVGGEAGLSPLGLGGRRDGVVYVPPGLDPARPAPVALMLHGAGGDARQLVPLMTPLADAHGLLLLAVDSRGATWDLILDDYGPDVAFIDRALRQVFARHAVDPGRVAVGGFSDGASYALSLGLANGGLFTHVLAFSPGFMAPPRTEGAPRVFVSHGVRDEVLPIARTSRRVVPTLERAGYGVVYREFPDGHVVPPELAREAVGWFVGG